MKGITFTYYDEDGGEEEFTLPSKYEVCERCRGEGRHTNPSIDGNGLRQEDVEDLDFMEDYMRGAYDVRCEECHGDRVVAVVDEDRADKAVLAKYHSRLEDEWAWEQECAAERRMGA